MTSQSKIDIQREDQIVNALIQRGYRTLAEYPIRHTAPGNVRAFRMYTDGVHVLCLQLFKSGGWGLYKPVSDSLDIEANIEAIPTR